MKLLAVYLLGTNLSKQRDMSFNMTVDSSAASVRRTQSLS